MSSVDRRHLLDDGVRRAVRAAGFGHLLLSDEALEASLAATLARREPGQPLWVFAYGSLIWSPLMQFAERRPARLHGWHRGFYLWSRINRGSPEVPGLVLALDRGGSCQGLACRIDDRTLEEDTRLLWRREMLMGTYAPRWVTAHTAAGPVRAVTFVVRRDTSSYAGRLSDDEVVAIICRARGHYGACRDYLLETADSLAAHHMADAHLARLARRCR